LTWIVPVWRTLAEMVRIRRQRSRQCCQLAALSERELQDFGMTRAEIAYELDRLVRRR